MSAGRREWSVQISTIRSSIQLPNGDAISGNLLHKYMEMCAEGGLGENSGGVHSGEVP